MEQQLRVALEQSLSSDRNTRVQAQKWIESIESQPQYAVLLLNLIEQESANASMAVGNSPAALSSRSVRQASAIAFKNFVTRHWAVNPEDPNASDFIAPEQDKQVVKARLVPLMTFAPVDVQRQLSEGVRVIASYDFPDQWLDLLPSLVQRMDPTTNDQRVINGVLETANAIFKRFRYVSESEELNAVLKYVLDNFQQQLLILFQTISNAAKECIQTGPLERIELLLAALRTMARIYFSLNWVTIPEFFEDNIEQWMTEFHFFLSLPSVGPPGPLKDKYIHEDEDQCPLDRLQLAILENVKLYADKYEEEFEKYLPIFIQDSWGLLVGAPATARFDQLVVMGMRLLCSTSSRVNNKKLFAEPGVLQNICEKIVAPNLLLRESDVEQFEDNPMEYLQWDIEGAESDSRRRVACDLIKALCQQFDAETTAICNTFLQSLVQDYSSAPQKNWRSLDGAITLFLALTVRASTARDGATQVSDAQQVNTFYSQLVYGILNGPVNDPKKLPVLEASCVKFISTMRGHLSREAIIQTLPLLVNCLDSKSVVVHTYAASAIEKIFSLNDVPAGAHPIYISLSQGKPANFSMQSTISGKRTPRYSAKDLNIILEPVLVKLINLMGNPALPENEYLIKALLRIVGVANENVRPIALMIVQKLGELILRVCANPANPTFNHCLFETVAATIKACGEGNLAQLETTLNPLFERILSNAITEFMPYVFQILAMTLEMYPASQGIPANYIPIFQALLTATLWEERGNVPALVRLLEVYLAKGADQVLSSNPQQLISGILGIFQKLLSAKSTEDSSLHLLTSIICSVRLDYYSMHIPAVFKLIFTKLEVSKSIKFAKAIIVFMSAFSGQHGPMMLMQGLEQARPGCSLQVINEIWTPYAPQVVGKYERKACLIGMSRMLSKEAIDFFDRTPAEWTLFFASAIDVFSSNTGSNTEVEDFSQDHMIEEFERWAESGHATGYSRLIYAQPHPRDWFKNVPDEKLFFCQQIAEISNLRPGKLKSILDEIQSTSKVMNFTAPFTLYAEQARIQLR